MLTGIRLISEAAEFAAHRHAGMQRKGGAGEPYINHLAEVANLLSIASDGGDAELVAAGWLHDCIEDTTTTQNELVQCFGGRVADLVSEVTDDMSRPKDERRKRQIDEAPAKSHGAKQIKIADKISNIRARNVPHGNAAQRAELSDYLGFAEKVVAGCRGVNPVLDALFDETVAKARST